MNYRAEYHSQGQEQTIQFGVISTSAARARASRLSCKGDLPGGWGQSVHLFGSDADGADQECYVYLGGALVEKDLVKDWDR